MIPSSMLHEHFIPLQSAIEEDPGKNERYEESLAKTRPQNNQPILPTKIIKPMLDFSVSSLKNHNHPAKPSKFVKKHPLPINH